MIVNRARRIQRFLSQPFYVAEQFTGVPGKTVPLDETIASFDALARGDYDHLPEQAFFNVGGIEEAEEKAKQLGGSPSHGRPGGPPGHPRARGVVREADFVTARGVDGDLGVLPGHAPLLAALAVGPVFIDAGGSRTAVAVDGGFLHVAHAGDVTRVDILAEQYAVPRRAGPDDAESHERRAEELRSEDRLDEPGRSRPRRPSAAGRRERADARPQTRRQASTA